MNDWLDTLKDSPKAKRNGVVVLVVIGLALAVLLMESGSDSRTGIAKGSGKPSRTLLTGDDSEALALSALKNRIDTMLDQLSESDRNAMTRHDETSKELDRLRRDVDAVKTQIGTTREQTRRAMGEIEKRVQQRLSAGDIALPPGSVRVGQPEGEGGSRALSDPSNRAGAGGSMLPAPIVQRRNQDGLDEPRMKIRSITQGAGDSAAMSVKQDGQGSDVEAEVEKDDGETYLPAGSILSGTLITGLDAPTGVLARRDPFPALMRVKAEAILPNRYSMDIRECFLLASGYAELSSERVMLRAERISCITEDRRVIENSVDAYVVGSDAKAGVRGRLVHRAGALLGKSLLAGFFGGIAQATQPQNILGIDTSPGGTALFQERELEDVATTGVYAGTSSAMERIADYYLEAAEQIFPIIELDGGRRVDFVLTSGFRMRAI